MIFLLAPLHGYCKWHCLPLSFIPVTQSLDTSFACNVRCERFVLLTNFKLEVRKIVSSQTSLTHIGIEHITSTNVAELLT
jgi:hypothetical protein